MLGPSRVLTLMRFAMRHNTIVFLAPASLYCASAARMVYRPFAHSHPRAERAGVADH